MMETPYPLLPAYFLEGIIEVLVLLDVVAVIVLHSFSALSAEMLQLLWFRVHDSCFRVSPEWNGLTTAPQYCEAVPRRARM